MRIGIVGAGGRMGQMLVREVLATEGVELVGAIDVPDSPAHGHDAGLLACGQPCGVPIQDDPVPLFADADAVLDFTAPAATVRFSALAAQGKTVHVIGTTGLEADQQQAIVRAARHTPIVQAPNFSLGVNLLFALAAKAAAVLGPDYDAEIIEMHHRLKVDAPSGTALGLGRAIAQGRDQDFDSVAVLSREGQTGARDTGAIGFATLRGGDVVGEHTAIFAGPGERLELTHKAADRSLFARGAVRAARWAYGKHPGLYGMADVLGL